MRRGASRSFGKATASCVAALLLLSACQQFAIDASEHPRFGASNLAARQGREDAMNTQWQNQHLSQLVAARGQPMLVMNIPGGGMPPSFVVVYGMDPGTGCIDAFAVSHDRDPRIRIYHCR